MPQPTPADNLKTLGIILPTPAVPVAAYLPLVEVKGDAGSLVFISGQLPMADGKLAYSGILGMGNLTGDAAINHGAAAAKLCAINILAQLQLAIKDLQRVKKIVKLGGFVASSHDFIDQPKVINGASELLIQVFGDRGKHARFAVSAVSLPLNASVEIDAIVAI